MTLGNGFSDMIPKAQVTKEKRKKKDKLDYIKIKNLCAVNDTKKVTRYSKNNSIFAKYVSGKVSVSSYIKNYI